MEVPKELIRLVFIDFVITLATNFLTIFSGCGPQRTHLWKCYLSLKPHCYSSYGCEVIEGGGIRNPTPVRKDKKSSVLIGLSVVYSCVGKAEVIGIQYPERTICKHAQYIALYFTALSIFLLD